MYYESYTILLVYVGFVCLLSMIIMFLPLLMAKSESYKQKLSEYECGFEPISAARPNFDIKYYLVAVLFLAFDLEIMFIFPWVVLGGAMTVTIFLSMMLFLSMLLLAFVYEWSVGVLDWN